MNKLIFDIKTHLGISIRCTEQYWQYIISVKHPALKDRLEDVIQTLKEPDQIRKSKTDTNVFFFTGERTLDGPVPGLKMKTTLVFSLLHIQQIRLKKEKLYGQNKTHPRSSWGIFDTMAWQS